MTRGTSRATPQGGAPKYEHPTGSCTDLQPVLSPKGQPLYDEAGEPRRVPCGGKLEHIRSVPANSSTNPGQQEYKCSVCGLTYIVSNRRWDEEGDVIYPSEKEEG